MIVAILAAYLSRIGPRDLFRRIAVGVIAALLLATAAGVVIYVTVRRYDDTRGAGDLRDGDVPARHRGAHLHDAWMRAHACGLSSDLRGRVDAAGTGAVNALWRCSPRRPSPATIETVVFCLAIAFSAGRSRVLIGAAAGLVVALGIAVVVYRLAHRLNIGRFFTIVGVTLSAFGAALLVDAVQNMQELGWLPVLTRPVWNTGDVLSEDTELGDLLHSILGYAQAPTVLQVLIYVGYLAVVVAAFSTLPAGSRQRVARPTGPEPAATAGSPLADLATRARIGRLPR